MITPDEVFRLGDDEFDRWLAEEQEKRFRSWSLAALDAARRRLVRACIQDQIQAQRDYMFEHGHLPRRVPGTHLPAAVRDALTDPGSRR